MERKEKVGGGRGEEERDSEGGKRECREQGSEKERQ
jgi:hypothetical protein